MERGLEKQSSWKTFPIRNPISNRNAARMDFNSTYVKTPFWSPREIESCPRPMRNSRRQSQEKLSVVRSVHSACFQHVRFFTQCAAVCFFYVMFTELFNVDVLMYACVLCFWFDDVYRLQFGVCDVVYVIRASLAGAVYYRLWLQYRRRIFQLADNTFSLTCQTGLAFLDRSVHITACI